LDSVPQRSGETNKEANEENQKEQKEIGIHSPIQTANSKNRLLMGQWNSPICAPLDRDVEVPLTDGFEEYLPSFLCRRAEDDWSDSKFKITLSSRFNAVAFRQQE
jgi:hypothetical protein